MHPTWIRVALAGATAGVLAVTAWEGVGAEEAPPPDSTVVEANEDADESGRSAESRTPPTAIEEIKVTARRRTENVQDMPVAITAFGAESLKDRGMTDIRDLSKFVPGLRLDTTVGSSNNARIFMRGLGQNEGWLDAEPGVALYVDDVFYSRSLGSIIAFSDMERAEVLRGSQASLYGKNAIGGAIMLHTRQPTSELGAEIEATIGDYSMLRTSSTFNLPILGEVLAARINLTTRQRDGYVDDFIRHDNQADERLLSANLKLRWDPTPDLGLLFTLNQSRSNTLSPTGECEEMPVGDPLLSADLADLARAFRSDDIDFPALTDPDGGLRDPEFEEVFGVSYAAACARSRSRDHLRSATELRPHSELDTWLGSMVVTWELPEVPVLGATTFKSISAWNGLEFSGQGDLDATALPLFRVWGKGIEHDSWQQELRLAGSTWGERVQWTTGGFYFREKSSNPPARIDVVAPSLARVGMRPFESSPGVLSPFTSPFMTLIVDTADIHTSLMFAGYAEVAAQPLERLSVTAGVRRTVERKDMQRDSETFLDDFADCSFLPALQSGPGCHVTELLGRIGVLVDPFRPPDERPDEPRDINDPNNWDPEIGVEHAKNSTRFDAWTSAVTASYDLTDFMPDLNDHLMVFAGWAKGYRSGGYNNISLNEDGSLNRFGPETTGSTEIGFKSRWLDQRLVVNASAYYTRWNDKQQRTRVANANPADGSRDAVQNAGNVTIRGAELEVMAIPYPDLVLHGTAAWIEDEYRHFIRINQLATRTASSAAGERVLVFDDLKHLRLPFTPRQEFSATAMYRIPLFDFGDVGLMVSYSHTSKIHHSLSNHTSNEASKYGLWDARVSWTSPDRTAEVAAFVRNATDRRYKTGVWRLPTSETHYFGAPRFFGLTLTKRFGGE